MASLDISSSRLVPAPGAAGWLCRSPGAVVWLPQALDAELVAQASAGTSATEIVGSAAARLADPGAPLLPPFAIIAGRGPDLVVVVHGPIELTVLQGGTELRLYGGEEVGSWLNRLVRNCSGVSGGKAATPDGPEDLREGVVRADGFLLTGGGEDGRRERTVGAGEPMEVGDGFSGDDEAMTPSFFSEEGADRERVGERQEDVLASQVVDVAGPDETTGGADDVSADREVIADRDLSGDLSGELGSDLRSDLSGDSPTVVEPVVADPDLTIAEPPAAGGNARELGRLNWDNGVVDALGAAVLIGRDVSNDPGVLAGELTPLVPDGQNDSMSRVHAELRPHGIELVVIDRGSTNGTFIWDEQSRAWQRLMPGEPQMVLAGGVLAFGERTATFEAVAAHVG